MNNKEIISNFREEINKTFTTKKWRKIQADIIAGKKVKGIRNKIIKELENIYEKNKVW
jgi:hypothetical protein